MAAEQSRTLLASDPPHPQEFFQKGCGLNIFPRICCLIHRRDLKSAGLRSDIQGLCDFSLDGFLITRFVPILVEQHFAFFTEQIVCRRRSQAVSSLQRMQISLSIGGLERLRQHGPAKCPA